VSKVVPLAEAPAPSSRPASRRGLLRLARQQPAAAVGAAILLFFVGVALLAPWIQPYNINQQVGPVFGAPSIHHWLGLDDGGIDMVSLLIQGGRVSLTVGFAATFVAILIGGGVGIVSGYFGGVVDTALMRITDYFLVIPTVPLMIVIAAIWGPSLSHIIFVIGILSWTSTARIVRAQVRSVRERVYVKRARSLGAGRTRIIFRHILPQIAPLVIANTVLTIAIAIFSETALAFLGLSDPSAISWGTMIERAFLRTAVSSGAWWAIVPPGVCVALVVMACYLLGQAIEDSLNPRLRVAHLSPRHFTVRMTTEDAGSL
jgi:peptide/nickel transport system permease protein